jgi:hypothetical protein
LRHAARWRSELVFGAARATISGVNDCILGAMGWSGKLYVFLMLDAVFFIAAAFGYFSRRRALGVAIAVVWYPVLLVISSRGLQKGWWIGAIVNAILSVVGFLLGFWLGHRPPEP